MADDVKMILRGIRRMSDGQHYVDIHDLVNWVRLQAAKGATLDRVLEELEKSLDPATWERTGFDPPVLPDPPTPQCDLPPSGWYCKLPKGHDGSCPTYPRWWNLRGRRWMARGR